MHAPFQGRVCVRADNRTEQEQAPGFVGAQVRLRRTCGGVRPRRVPAQPERAPHALGI